jgi:hypothetical protein
VASRTRGDADLLIIMFKKFLIRAAVLGAAVTLPAMFFGFTDQAKGIWNRVTAAPQTASAQNQAPPVSLPAKGGPSALSAPLPAMIPGEKPAVPVEGAPVRSLVEVLQFGVAPEWVLSRWPHVTTGLAQLQLQGYRVALVTGTAEYDVAGALTYYFNPQQQCQRITFRGSTGDPRQLIAAVASQHQMARRAMNDPGLVVWESPHLASEPASTLRVRAAPIVKASDPYRRYEVDLVLERPEGQAP